MLRVERSFCTDSRLLAPVEVRAVGFRDELLRLRFLYFVFPTCENIRAEGLGRGESTVLLAEANRRFFRGEVHVHVDVA